MEGRLALYESPEEFRIKSGITSSSAPVNEYLREGRYNISTSDLLVITTHASLAEAIVSKWGLIPAGAGSGKSGKGMASISTSSLLNKPALQKAITGNRCLIWCNGFYLWKNSPAGKIPFYVTSPSKDLFSIAGTWESWEESSNTSCFITHSSASLLPFFGSEMPVVIRKDQRSTWLSSSINPIEVLSSPALITETSFEYYPVNRRIIKSPDNDPRFIERVPYLVAEQTSMFS